ncbi:MAG: efflux RND transporter periplasmic adaptor subunit [candidate division Zixibacteria bacterium]|nr:efflux RND transporter periplasmic adaptor subunit [candidate division Zixibacteria bacterium]
MRRINVILAVSALLAVGSLSMIGCGGNGGAETVVDERIPVFTTMVERTDLAQTRPYSGTVEGERQATVYARIPETVERVFVSEGESVSRGDKVLAFDESGPNSVVRQARAVAEDARKTAERFQRLYEQGAVSELERDARHTQYEVAKADYDAAHDQVEVSSPITGTVTEVYAREGRQLSVGRPIALIASIDTVRVLIDVSIYESSDIKEGQSVTIRSELDSTLVAHGWVDEVSVSADVESRNVPVEILVENPSHRLLPGMFVRADVELQRRENVRSIPRDALVYRQSGLGVFVIRDSTAHYEPVTIGIESDGFVEVVEGPDVNIEVVTLGQSNLQDGTRVNPIRERESETAGSDLP